MFKHEVMVGVSTHETMENPGQMILVSQLKNHNPYFEMGNLIVFSSIDLACHAAKWRHGCELVQRSRIWPGPQDEDARRPRRDSISCKTGCLERKVVCSCFDGVILYAG